MRLQKLNIHNIASIEDAEIDFLAQPLASSEVFLITGKTGSGKTTILDAICLALFATTPRLKNTQMKGDVPNEKDLKLNNAEQLMRRNTGEAWVKLTFTGNNGNLYEAMWSVARAHKKTNGNIQDSQWTLKNLDAGNVISNKKEILKTIPIIIGLDFEQFCRTTMLAQGEFTKFLNSKDEDKSAILGKITGTEIYTKIGAKIFAITSAKKQEWEKANQRIADVKVLDSEEIEQMNNQQSQLEKDYKSKKSQQDVIKSKLQWLSNDERLKLEINRAQETLNAAKQKEQDEEFKKQEALVKDWNATIEARSWLSGKNRAINDIEANKNKLNQLLNDFLRIREGQLWLEQDIATKKNEHQATLRFLDENESRKAVYTNEQTISAHLDAIVKCLENIKKENKAIDDANAKLNGPLKEKLEKAKTDFETKSNQIKESQKLLKMLEQELAKIKLQELRNQKDELAKNISQISNALLMVDSLNKAKDSVEATEKTIATTNKTIEELESKLKQQDDERKNAEQERDKEKAVCDKLRESVDDWAKSVRVKLHVGEKCPVCQQEIVSEPPHEELLDSIFAKAEKDLKEAEALLEAKKNVYNATIARLEAQQNVLKDKKKDLEKAQKLLEKENAKAIGACQECGIHTVDDTTKQRLNDLMTENNNKLEILKKQVMNGEDKEKEHKKQNKLVIKLQQELNDSNNKLNDVNREIANCQAGIESSNKIKVTEQGDLTIHQNEVEKLVVLSDWTNDWRTEPMLFATELKTAARFYQQQVEKEQQQAHAITQATADFNHACDSIATVITAMPSWSDVTATNSRKINNLLKVINDLNTNISSLKAQINQLQNTENEMTSNLEKWIAENPSLNVEALAVLSQYGQQEIGELQKSQKNIHDEVLRQETSLKDCKNRLVKHNEEKPEFAEEENSESLNTMSKATEEAVRLLGEQIGGIKEKLENDAKQKEQLGQLIDDCNTKKAVYEKWQRLNLLLGDSTGKKFRNIALSYILENLIHSANVYMKTLTNRYRLLVEPGTFIISVEDAYQGCTTRTANTISGGESFLVSLALALALSDIARQLQVDLLFIDEGFGTLSGEPLQKAIETLRTLHNATGRQVGIISHVEELRERIPVQIKVEQEGNSSSSTVEVVEN